MSNERKLVIFNHLKKETHDRDQRRMNIRYYRCIFILSTFLSLALLVFITPPAQGDGQSRMEQIPYAGYRSQYYDDASHHARAWRGTDFVPRNNYVVETWANHRGQSAVARVQSSINYHPDYVIDAVDPEGAVPEDGKTSSHTWRCGWFSINTYITRWTDCHPDMYYETYHNGPHANWYYHGDGNIGWQEDWGPVRFGHAAQWNWITHGDGPTCDVYIYSNTVTRSWGKWFGIWGWEYDYDVQYDSWIFHLPHNQ